MTDNWTQYGIKKRSASREKSVLDGIRSEPGRLFIREIDGDAVGGWYENLTAVRDLSQGTAVRHFNVMHHMMEKAWLDAMYRGRKTRTATKF